MTVENMQEAAATQKIGSVHPMERFGTSILLLTSPNDDLYRFELFLRRLKVDSEGNLVKLSDTTRPMLNDMGVNDILSCMSSVINRSIALSNLEEWEVYLLLEQTSFSIITLLTFNGYLYGVAESDRQAICASARNFTYAFLKRAYHEGDKRFFSKTVVQSFSETKNTAPRQGSSLNPINWFKGGEKAQQ